MLTLKGHDAGVQGAAFSPDGWRLATVDWGGTVKLWDTGLLVREGHRSTLLVDRGCVQGELGLAARAVADFSAAIALEAHDARPWYLRARAYEQLGQSSKAGSDYDEAIRLNRAYVVKAYTGRADAERLQKAYSKALANYSRALELDAASAVAYHGRGLT